MGKLFWQVGKLFWQLCELVITVTLLPVNPSKWIFFEEDSVELGQSLRLALGVLRDPAKFSGFYFKL